MAPGTPGVTDTTVRVGILEYDTQASDQVNAAVSGNPGRMSDRANTSQIYNAVIAHMNALGGLGGRKIVPVYARQDAAQYASSSGRQRELQRACAQFTEDTPVFAISGAGAIEETIVECAAQTHTVFVANWVQAYPDLKRFAEIADYWYAPHGFVAEHREGGLARELLAQGFFTPHAKVALMVEDRPGIRSGVEKRMRPILERAGLDVTEIVYPDFVASPWDTYILQLQSAGVTHIVVSGSSGRSTPTDFLMKAADKQGYHPRWGLASDNTPTFLAESAPRAQLANVRGMSWRPSDDIYVDYDTSSPDRACRKLVPPKTEPGNRRTTCEFLFFLKAAFDRMDGISTAEFANAVESLGTSYTSTLTIDGVTRFGPGRHDGPELVRAFTFDSRCGDEGVPCFKYVGNPHRLAR